jgi:hypothetical protein
MNLNLQIAQNQQNLKFVQKIKDDYFQVWPAILAFGG